MRLFADNQGVALEAQQATARASRLGGPLPTLTLVPAKASQGWGAQAAAGAAGPLGRRPCPPAPLKQLVVGVGGGLPTTTRACPLPPPALLNTRGRPPARAFLVALPMRRPNVAPARTRACCSYRGGTEDAAGADVAHPGGNCRVPLAHGGYYRGTEGTRAGLSSACKQGGLCKALTASPGQCGWETNPAPGAALPHTGIKGSPARSRKARPLLRPLPPVSHPCAPCLQGRPRDIIITRPGLVVTVRQPYLGGGLVRWLDVATKLTRVPWAPRGVLGYTFPSISK